MSREIPLDGGPAEVRGAFQLDRTSMGLLPRRLPTWTRPQIPDLFMDAMVQVPSGCRLALRTDSRSLELDVHTRGFEIVPSHTNRPPVLQLDVDGELVGEAAVEGGSLVRIDRRRGPEGIEFVEGSPATLRWDDLAPGDKTVEVWLPANATVELRALRVDDGATVDIAPRRGPRWTHYGSSISHCMDVERPLDVWPVQVARKYGLELTSFGFAGQCQLDPFMGRVIRDHPADAISVKLGINLVNAASMTQRTFGPAVHGLLDTIREGQPTTPVLVVSPIFCPSCEDRPGPTVPQDDDTFDVVAASYDVQPLGLTLRFVRATLTGIVAVRRAQGDTALHYLDGLSLLGAAEEPMLYDRLHPTPDGYRLLGERFGAAAFGPAGPLRVGEQ